MFNNPLIPQVHQQALETALMKRSNKGLEGVVIELYTLALAKMQVKEATPSSGKIHVTFMVASGGERLATATDYESGLYIQLGTTSKGDVFYFGQKWIMGWTQGNGQENIRLL